MVETLNHFMNGAIAMCCGVAGLFFLRFWRKSHDRLFMLFAIAFWVLGVNRIALTFVQQTDESRTFLYVVRLIAFLIILVAIVDKNRARSAPRHPPV